MSRIAMALREYGETEGLPTPECVGAKFHSPHPLVVEYVGVIGLEEHIPLCGTCSDNLRVFLSLMTASEGSLPWEVRREFGNRLRAWGMKAWNGREST